jgi:ribonuclease HII
LSDYLICGVDEVGRGPLAGPVVAAAVILNPRCPIDGLADSKKLSARRREQLYEEIAQCSLAWALGRAESTEIDEINILQASLLAMRRAVEALSLAPSLALIDGNRCPDIACETRAVIGGDATEPCISAASIMAKVTRDREMVSLDQRHPGYGFAAHKGYPTRQHLAALEMLGPVPEHRQSFGPVKKKIKNKNNS